MANYEYSCDACEIIFERMRPMSEYNKPYNCPECGKSCPVIPSVANHMFVFPESQLRGTAPPNTGTSHDFNFDTAIGRDAEKNWKLIGERQQYKNRVLRNNPGATGHDLSRTRDGDYRVMKPEERKQSEAGRAIGDKLPVNRPPKK